MANQASNGILSVTRALFTSHIRLVLCLFSAKAAMPRSVCAAQTIGLSQADSPAPAASISCGANNYDHLVAASRCSGSRLDWPFLLLLGWR